MQGRVISCGRCGLKLILLSYTVHIIPSHLLREMWIEICKGNAVESVHSESSPAGDVDWNTWILTMVCMGLWVISCGRCGLKYLFSIANQQDYIESSPAGDVDWNFIWPFIICRYIESSPAGDVDWNRVTVVHAASPCWVISCGRCGLKLWKVNLACWLIWVISCGRCGLKLCICEWKQYNGRVISCGRCGLKLSGRSRTPRGSRSHLLREM